MKDERRRKRRRGRRRGEGGEGETGGETDSTLAYILERGEYTLPINGRNPETEAEAERLCYTT